MLSNSTKAVALIAGSIVALSTVVIANPLGDQRGERDLPGVEVPAHRPGELLLLLNKQQPNQETALSARSAPVGLGVVGACCFADGSCVELTSTGCMEMSGIYQGDGATCAEGPCCEVVCDGDPEGEVDCFENYNDLYNSGCNASDGSLPSTPITYGQTYCGNAGFFTFVDPVSGPTIFRDTDWYRITHFGGPLGFTLESESMPMLTGVLSIDQNAPDPCDSISIVILGDVAACVDGGAVVDAGDQPAGDYFLFVGASFTLNDGTEGCGWEYKIRAGDGPDCLPSANVDGIGGVNLKDLNLVLDNFGASGNDPGTLGDADCDGDTDLQDLNAVLGAYGS